jgi:6-pyruvoyltetrahydropterin/6-carboxytetrahydropterin synthase
MHRATLIRTARFKAAHHYRRPDWTEAENARVFGENVVPHEHEYGLEVTLAGEPDPRTGFLVDLPALDAVLEEIIGPLRGSNLAHSIGGTRQEVWMPSTENLARWFYERLEPLIPKPARLVKVRISESDVLSAEFGEG